MPRPKAASAARVVERVMRCSIVLRDVGVFFIIIDALSVIILVMLSTSYYFVLPCILPCL
jgi:hypothetical protein